MTSRDLGAIRFWSDTILGRVIRESIEKIHVALYEIGCLNEVPSDASQIFNAEEKEILRLMIDEKPREGWPEWVWTRALDRFVREMVRVTSSSQESFLDKAAVVAIPGAIRVKANLPWAIVEGYVDRATGQPRALLLSINILEEGWELTELTWNQVEQALISAELKQRQER